MSNALKKGGKKENYPKQCDKCECLILSDNSDKCVRPKAVKEKNLYESSGEADESSGDGIVISPKCHETIKIYVKGGPCQEDSTPHDRDIWTVHNSETGDDTTPRLEPAPPDYRPAPQNTHPAVQITPSDPQTTPSKTTPTQTDEENAPQKKSLCFRLCRKKKADGAKKGGGDAGKKSDNKKSKKTDKCHKDCNTQTCQSGKIADDLGEIGDFLKSCGKAGGGGCNTNTIIFPRDQSGGDGIANLENMLRLEAKTNSRNVEDIMNELHRQRREIYELKDMLDTVMRAVREQLFMTAFGKGKAELIEDLNRKNNLERKSNTMSMRSCNEKIEKVRITDSHTPPPPPPPEKKKKKFFLWCK